MNITLLLLLLPTLCHYLCPLSPLNLVCSVFIFDFEMNIGSRCITILPLDVSNTADESSATTSSV